MRHLCRCAFVLLLAATFFADADHAVDEFIEQLISELTYGRNLDVLPWATHLNNKFGELVDYVRCDDSHAAVIDYLLNGRDGEDRKNRIILALKIWTESPDDLCDERDLLLCLLYDYEIIPEEFINDITIIIDSMRIDALSATEDDDFSVLEHFLDQRTDISSRDIQVAVQLANAQQDDLGQVRIRTSFRLDVRIWIQIFHERNAESLSTLDGIAFFFDQIDSGQQASALFRAAVIMEMGRADSFDDLLDAQVAKLLSDCPILYHSPVLSEQEVVALRRLFLRCQKNADLQHRVLSEIPSMFSSFSSAQAIFKEFFYCMASNNDDHLPDFESKLSFSLLSAVLEYDPAYLDSLDDYSHRAFLLHFLSEGLTSFKDNRPKPNSVLDTLPSVLHACSRVRNDPRLRRLSSVALALAFRTIIPRNMIEILCELPEFHDDQLRYALAMSSAFQNFLPFMDNLRMAHSSVFERFYQLVPDKFTRKHIAFGLNDDQSKMTVRAVSSIESDYEITAPNADDPAGTVFTGRDRRAAADSEIAIKIARRGSQETEIMSQLCVGKDRLSGLVELLDLFDYQQRTYIVMEHIRGRTLSNWSVPDSEDDAVAELISITLQILSIVNRIYERGWRFSELQCSNFMIESDSKKVILVDFSHAHRIDQASVPPFVRDLVNLISVLRNLARRVRAALDIPWFVRSPSLAQFEEVLDRWLIGPASSSDLVQAPMFNRLKSPFSLTSTASSATSADPHLQTQAVEAHPLCTNGDISVPEIGADRFCKDCGPVPDQQSPAKVDDCMSSPSYVLGAASDGQGELQPIDGHDETNLLQFSHADGLFESETCRDRVESDRLAFPEEATVSDFQEFGGLARSDQLQPSDVDDRLDREPIEPSLEDDERLSHHNTDLSNALPPLKHDEEDRLSPVDYNMPDSLPFTDVANNAILETDSSANGSAVDDIVPIVAVDSNRQASLDRQPSQTTPSMFWTDGSDCSASATASASANTLHRAPSGFDVSDSVARPKAGISDTNLLSHDSDSNDAAFYDQGPLLSPRARSGSQLLSESGQPYAGHYSDPSAANRQHDDLLPSGQVDEFNPQLSSVQTRGRLSPYSVNDRTKSDSKLSSPDFDVIVLTPHLDNGDGELQTSIRISNGDSSPNLELGDNGPLLAPDSLREDLPFTLSAAGGADRSRSDADSNEGTIPDVNRDGFESESTTAPINGDCGSADDVSNIHPQQESDQQSAISNHPSSCADPPSGCQVESTVNSSKDSCRYSIFIGVGVGGFACMVAGIWVFYRRAKIRRLAQGLQSAWDE